MSDDVSIVFRAQIEDLIAGVDKIKDQLKQIGESAKPAADSLNGIGTNIKAIDTAPIEATRSAMGGLHEAAAAGVDEIANLSKQFASLNDAISKGGAGGSSSWIKAILGGGAIAAAAAGAVDLVDKVNSEMLELERNAKAAGLSLEKIQELKYAANLSGVKNDQFVSGLQEAAKKLNDLARDTNDLSKFLDANNVKYKEQNGQLISMNSYIEKAAMLIRNAGTEADKVHFAELMGFSRQWVGLLEQGPTALKKTEAEAHAVGAVLDDELVKRAADMEKEWNHATLQWSTYFKSAIIELTPYVTKLVNYVFDTAVALGKAIKEDFAEPAKGALKEVSSAAAGIVTSTGRWGAELTAAGLSGSRIGETFKSYSGSFLQLNSQLGGFTAASTKAEAIWAKIKSDAVGTAEAAGKAAEAADKGPTTKYAPKDEGPDRDAIQAQIEQIRERIRLADEAYTEEAMKIKASAAAFIGGEAQKTAALLAALDRRSDAEQKALADGLAINDLGQAQTERMYAEGLRLAEKYNKDRLANDIAAAKAEEATWKSAADDIASAFNSQLRGLLAGTTSWGQAMKNISGDMLMKFIADIDKRALEWVAKQLFMTTTGKALQATDLAGFLGIQTAKTTAVQTSAAAQVAAQQEASLATLPGRMTKFVSDITADAAVTFAGVFANLAPLLGPGAAGPASASQAVVLAQIANVPKMETGGLVLGGGLAFLHSNEAVLPARVAGPLQDGQLGGGGDTHFHFNIDATDARSFRSMLMNTNSGLVQAIQLAVRNGQLKPA